MALHFDLRNVKDRDALYVREEGTDDFRLLPVTEVLIHLLGLVLGFHEITEKNYEKVFQRIDALAKVGGLYLTEVIHGRRFMKALTLEDVKRHIGLSTNGGRLTEAQFKKHVLVVAEEAAKRYTRQYLREKEELRGLHADTYVVILNYPTGIDVKYFETIDGACKFAREEVERLQTRYKIEGKLPADVSDVLEWWNTKMGSVPDPHLIQLHYGVRQ